MMLITSRIFAELCLLCLLALVVVDIVEALGRAPAPPSNVGEYGPQNTPPKPYSFNYEVTDDNGNVHYHREQGDPSGIITGSYGYMNMNGLFRSVEYMADSMGYRAKIKTNEPGTKGPGSADVDLQADPAPPGLQEMFERKAPTLGPVPAPRPVPAPASASRPSYPGIKG